LLGFFHAVRFVLERAASGERVVVTGHTKIEACFADDLFEQSTLFERAARRQSEAADGATCRNKNSKESDAYCEGGGASGGKKGRGGEARLSE